MLDCNVVFEVKNPDANNMLQLATPPLNLWNQLVNATLKINFTQRN